MNIPLSPKIKRFLKYSAVGVGTLLIDLVILFFLSSVFSIPYYVGTACAFSIGVSINFILSRALVFKGSERPWRESYLYFISIGVGGALVTTTLVVLLVHYLSFYYLLARVLVAGIVGMGNYLINLYCNFKVVGKHVE